MALFDLRFQIWKAQVTDDPAKVSFESVSFCLPTISHVSVSPPTHIFALSAYLVDLAMLTDKKFVLLSASASSASNRQDNLFKFMRKRKENGGRQK